MTADVLAWVGAVGGVAATAFAILAWRDARPLEPFSVTESNDGTVFGLRSLTEGRVVIDHVHIPHSHALHTADDAFRDGGVEMHRGQLVLWFYGNDHGLDAPFDVVVTWHRIGWHWRLLRRGGPRYWGTHVLKG